MQVTTETRFFHNVEPLPDYKLSVDTMHGKRIIFFFSRLFTTRYGDLHNVTLFNSVRTDGINLIFQIPRLIPVTVSAGEFFQLPATNSLKQHSDIVKEETILKS